MSGIWALGSSLMAIRQVRFGSRDARTELVRLAPLVMLWHGVFLRVNMQHVRLRGSATRSASPGGRNAPICIQLPT